MASVPEIISSLGAADGTVQQAQPGEADARDSDPADAMIRRNHVLKAERIEQLALVSIEPPHRRQPPRHHPLLLNSFRFFRSRGRSGPFLSCPTPQRTAETISTCSAANQ